MTFDPNDPSGPAGWGEPPGPSGQQPPSWGQPPPYGQQVPPGYQPYPTQPSSNQFGGPVLAGWWYRVGATVIDALIIVIPCAIIGAVSGSRVLYYILVGVAQLAYTTLLIGGSGGRTVGQMALGTQTLDATTGTTIGYGRAFIRWLVSAALSLVVIIGSLLDILWPLWDSKNQTIHDKAVKSVVVVTRR